MPGDDERARLIAQLHTAHEQGVLDDAAFRAALVALDPGGTFSAAAERNTTAQGSGSTAVGERGAQANDVEGSIVTGDNNSVTHITTIYQQAHGRAKLDVEAFVRGAGAERVAVAREEMVRVLEMIVDMTEDGGARDAAADILEKL